MSYDIKCLFDVNDAIGEGPYWDASTGNVLWVDIFRGLLHRGHLATGELTTTELGEPLVFALPSKSGGLVVGRYHTVEHIAEDGTTTVLCTVDADDEDLRLQDAKADTKGRLVFGMISLSRKLRKGNLYSLDPSGEVTVLRTGVSLSNGLDWSPDGSLLYHIDSDMQNIEVHDYDQETGLISNSRVFASIALDDGLPDGMTVDAEGGVWVSLFWGQKLRHYSADGKLVEQIAMPTSNTTSVAFAGDDLGTLVITSASEWLVEGAPQSTPGALFGFTPGVKGKLPHEFGL